jgi:hypothetical protein
MIPTRLQEASMNDTNERREGPRRRAGTDRREGIDRRCNDGRPEDDGERIGDRRSGRERRLFRDRRTEGNCQFCGLWDDPLLRCPKCGKMMCAMCARVAWIVLQHDEDKTTCQELLLVCAECLHRMPEELRHRPRASKGSLSEWLGLSPGTLENVIMTMRGNAAQAGDACNCGEA